MRILLVFPKIEHGVTTYHDRNTPFAKLFGNPSLSLPQVAACTPPGHEIRILNENFEDIDFSEHWDLVGINVLTMTAPHVYRLSEKFREYGMKVVLGGYHPTALPEEAKQHADSVVIGEAEEIWPQVVHDAEKGKLKSFYYGSHVDPAKIPPPRRDLVKYPPLTEGIQASRGCPNACEFCATSVFLGRKVRTRPIEHVIEEMKSIPNKVLIFRDASMTLNVKYSMELFKAMKPLKKKFIANANINIISRNEKFLRLAKEAGAISFFVGFESINPESLKEAHKISNKAEMYEKAIKVVKKYDIGIVGGFIFGFDHDTPEIFDTTRDAVLSWEIDSAEFNILTPYPGTPLYDRFDKEGRILTKDWSKYTQAHVVYMPKQMTPKELFDGTRKVIKSFYSMPEMIKRIYRSLKMDKFAPYSLSLPTINIAMRRYYKREFFNGNYKEKLPPNWT
ncbi:MAG: B12-binding domain-containing radical SAM protein [Thermoplasmata archaeon]|nr:MAG: B12-binding domain-containing radical SAM protein [Thermoplasmata archaeon]